MMLEKDIESAVCNYARSLGMLAYKFNSASCRSVPDRMFVYNGQITFVEFKRAGAKPTVAQLREHNRLRAQGCCVIVIDNVIDGNKAVDRMVSD